MKDTPGIFRVLCVVGACAGTTLAVAFVNLWLGILVMPIAYSISESLLSD